MSTAELALTAPAVTTLRLPGWQCEPYEMQSRGIVWLYATPRAFLADVTGTGKTIHGIGLAALLMAKGEAHRLVYVVESGTVGQWCEEFRKMLPGANVVTNQGLNKAERNGLYRYGWDVLVTSYALMWRDSVALSGLCPSLVWFDESTAFKDPDTKTAKGARMLASNAQRVICATATPLQNALTDVFSQLEVMGLAGTPNSLFGTLAQFEARYLQRTPEIIFLKGGRTRTNMRVTGYQNMDEMRAKLAPYWLRRTEGSGDMPDVMPPEDIYVPMTTAQHTAYVEMRRGALNGADVNLAAKAHYLHQICSGLSTVGLGDESGKLDWLLASLRTRFVSDEGQPEKVVVFTRWLGTVSALSRRLHEAGIGYGVISGSQSATDRDEARRRFWEDPTCQVMVITTAGEKGLNLQCAKYVVMVDLMWNPARIEQILGRIKRSGSLHSHVFLLRLITPESVEPGTLSLLARKQTIADFVNGDESDLFEKLSAEELRTIIRTGS